MFVVIHMFDSSIIAQIPPYSVVAPQYYSAVDIEYVGLLMKIWISVGVYTICRRGYKKFVRSVIRSFLHFLKHDLAVVQPYTFILNFKWLLLEYIPSFKLFFIINSITTFLSDNYHPLLCPRSQWLVQSVFQWCMFLRFSRRPRWSFSTRKIIRLSDTTYQVTNRHHAIIVGRGYSHSRDNNGRRIGDIRLRPKCTWTGHSDCV